MNDINKNFVFFSNIRKYIEFLTLEIFNVKNEFKILEVQLNIKKDY